MEEKQVAAYQKLAERGSVVRAMCQTPGFKYLQETLTAKINDLRQKWLTADEVEANKIKLRAQVYNEVLEELKKMILAGDAAHKALNDLNRDSEKE